MELGGNTMRITRMDNEEKNTDSNISSMSNSQGNNSSSVIAASLEMKSNHISPSVLQLNSSSRGSLSNDFSEEDEEEDDRDDDGGISAEGEDTDSNDDEEESDGDGESDSFFLNPNVEQPSFDGEGIGLLKQIFPEESTSDLKQLHRQHVEKQQEVLQHPASCDPPPSAMAAASATSSSPTSQSPSPRVQSQVPKIIQEQQHTDGSSSTPSTSDSDNKHQSQQQQADEDGRRETKMSLESFSLPDDFLRLPTSVAVRRPYRIATTSHGTQQQLFRYEMIEDLEQRALQEYPKASVHNQYFTVTVERHPKLGLGLSLIGAPSLKCMKVVGLIDFGDEVNASAEAGIQVNDYIIGINGSAFASSFYSSSFDTTPSSSSSSKFTLMQHSIQAIQRSPNPVVMHVQRCPEPLNLERTTSLLDSSALEDDDNDDEINDNLSSSRNQNANMTTTTPMKATAKYKTTPTIHPFASALTKRSLIQSIQDEKLITQSLQRYTDRARQWESANAFRMDGYGHRSMTQKFDPKDLPPDMAELFLATDDDPDPSSPNNNNNNTFWPSTPTLTHDSPLIPLEYTHAFFGMDNHTPKHKTKFAPTRTNVNMNNHDSSFSKTPPSSRDTYPGSRKGHRSPPRSQTSSQRSPPRAASSRMGYPGSNTSRQWSPQRSQSAYPGNDTQSTLATTQHQQRSLTLSPQQQQPFPKRPDIFIPLYGIRKALSARIVNIFIEGDTRVAYTIWVYDVESGREWYAPIRYFEDFADLRMATMKIAPQIGDFEFPKQKFFFARRLGGEAKEPEHVREAKSRQLEHFLRGLCSMIYTCQPLHPDVAEIAIHVQSFLGVESGLAETDLDEQRAVLEESSLPNHNPHQWKARMELKRSVQRYTWRLFLLNTMKAIVNDFVDTARSRGPKLKDIESLEAKGRTNLKARAMSDLERIQNFLDQLVDLILDGCSDDLKSISSRREYGSIRTMLDDGEAYWDRLVREAVREQVEIEVYVPLRSVVSRLLVNGWRHEDMEVQFKIKELGKRPQGMFRIPPEKISPSHWQSVALILKRGVGMSTLPSAKLRAIVEAAREISRVHEREHGTDLVGADDFLPIFIFCVVRAEMERPCALCVLLRTLCDRINRIGEIGYFLASFEAAITHMQEIDLTEDKEEMLSFLTIPLTEIPLEESR